MRQFRISDMNIDYANIEKKQWFYSPMMKLHRNIDFYVYDDRNTKKLREEIEEIRKNRGELLQFYI